MSAIAILAAISVAFPRPGQTLPPVDCTYMSGAVPRGTVDIVVQGRPVEVYKTGGWVTMVDVAEGVNSIEISANGETTNVTVRVERKPTPKLDSAGNPVTAPERVYEKLPYAADTARPQTKQNQIKPILNCFFLFFFVFFCFAGDRKAV